MQSSPSVRREDMTAIRLTGLGGLPTPQVGRLLPSSLQASSMDRDTSHP